MGHAGSDAEFVYRKMSEIEANEFQDPPLLHSARILLENNMLNAEQIIDIYNNIENRVVQVAEAAASKPKLATAKQVMASIVPPARKNKHHVEVDDNQRLSLFSHEKHNLNKPQHLAKLLNWGVA